MALVARIDAFHAERQWAQALAAAEEAAAVPDASAAVRWRLARALYDASRAEAAPERRRMEERGLAVAQAGVAECGDDAEAYALHKWLAIFLTTAPSRVDRLRSAAAVGEHLRIALAARPDDATALRVCVPPPAARWLPC